MCCKNVKLHAHFLQFCILFVLFALISLKPVYAYSHSNDDKIVQKVKALNNIHNGYQVVDVTGYGINEKNRKEVYENIIFSYPELFYVKWGANWYSTFDASGNVKSIGFPLISSDAKTIKNEINTYNNALNRAYSEIKSNTKGMSTEEIALACQEYIIKITAYSRKSNNASRMKYTSYGVFVNHEAVCNGYSLAYQDLLSKFGIQSGYVYSQKKNHGWTIVQINSKWYHVDVCADDVVYDQAGTDTHKHFLLSEKSILNSKIVKGEKSSGLSIYAKSNIKPKKATDTSKEKKFWTKTSSLMHYYNGCWYYAVDSTKTHSIVKYNNRTKRTNTVIKNLGQWKVANSRSHWVDNFGKIAGKGKYLYYSTPKSIYRLDLTTNAKKKILTVKGPKQIYSMKLIYPNKLYYSARTNPVLSSEEKLVKYTVR